MVKFKKGDRVTGQTPTWHDGEPVQNWPNSQYIGTVKSVKRIAGCEYLSVKFDSGRHDFLNVDRAYKVPVNPASTEAQGETIEWLKRFERGTI